MSDPVRLSKTLSHALRHRPDALGIVLDPHGWTDVDVLLDRLRAAGHGVTREALEAVVRTNDKQRFALSDDGRRIRANQGHSVPVDLGLVPLAPPDVLYHGTATRHVPSILAHGLRPGTRQHVHLSAAPETALAVGRRHGAPLVLRVDAAGFHAAGGTFWQSADGVWLAEAVPAAFLSVEEAAPADQASRSAKSLRSRR